MQAETQVKVINWHDQRGMSPSAWRFNGCWTLDNIFGHMVYIVEQVQEIQSTEMGLLYSDQPLTYDQWHNMVAVANDLRTHCPSESAHRLYLEVVKRGMRDVLVVATETPKCNNRVSDGRNHKDEEEWRNCSKCQARHLLYAWLSGINCSVQSVHKDLHRERNEAIEEFVLQIGCIARSAGR